MNKQSVWTKTTLSMLALLAAHGAGAQTVGPLRQTFKAGEVYRYRVHVSYQPNRYNMEQHFEFDLILNEQTTKVNGDGTAEVHSFLAQPKITANGLDVGISKETRLAILPEINAMRMPQGRITTATLLRKGATANETEQNVGLVAQLTSPLLPEKRVPFGETWTMGIGPSSPPERTDPPQATITLVSTTREQGRAAYKTRVAAAFIAGGDDATYAAYGLVDARTGRYLHLEATLTGGPFHIGSATLTLDALPAAVNTK